MNRPLRRMSAVVMVLFGLLLLNANYIQVLQAEDLRDRDTARTIVAEYANERGPILVGGEPVASSTPSDDELAYLRQYTEGPLYAHSTGYYSFVYGATAVESDMNSVLAGTDDSLFVSRLGDLLTGRERQGGAVALTLDPAAQRAAAEGLADVGEDVRGAVVALRPATGEILAMVSLPSYDPNVLSSHDGGAVREAYEALDADESRPLFNRATNEVYPPGSTFKLVTLAAALSSGRYDRSTPVPGPAELDLPQTGTTLPNSSEAQCTPGSDTTDLAQALRESCNTTFGALALDLGADAVREQAEAFGFGTEVDVPTGSAASRYPAEPDPPQTALTGIGQSDVAATPLQMAMVAAGIANNGRVMRPYLVRDVRGPDTEVLDTTEPEELSQAVEPDVAAEIRDLMVEVVEDGTGGNAQIDGVEVAGKTGTAQQGEGEPPHAWFVSFAPAQDPQVAVAVLVEDGGGQGEISGNRLAAPVAREVMEAVLGGGS